MQGLKENSEKKKLSTSSKQLAFGKSVLHSNYKILKVTFNVNKHQ